MSLGVGESIKRVSGIYSREEVKTLPILKVTFRQGNVNNLLLLRVYCFWWGGANPKIIANFIQFSLHELPC